MRNKQRGVFAIEMSFVMFFLAALLFFTGDIAYKLFNRGNLDRASYSLVNIVKERSRFYDKRFELNQQDLSDMQKLASELLNDHKQFGLRVESLVKGSYQEFNNTVDASTACSTLDSLNNPKRKELVPVSLKGKEFPLYQVTLCYRVDNWFDRFMGKNKTSYLHSSSVIAGR
ncbi:tight adherence pilus pseudopilin TadF [Photobacterium lipolyticum]|uniref:Membrane associated secretion system protein n=1 Tax=Photobacterium lipolyticum TaxID=266810 RepID=A0A2T3N4P9_9GAMM|nr:tight adherence pilus pseudopilin TadF [Photobacterium lipolyticum]PSW07400.1 hypothetical protein C9I89_01380 [Photobacterium lipolyticum]